MEQELLLREVKSGQMRVLVENLNTSINENGGVTVQGLALPFGKTSRNGFHYIEESVKKTFETLIGKPVLFNHDINRVIGHVSGASISDEGLVYEMDIDPEEKDIVRKIKRGDIKNVSIQVMYDKDKSYISEDGVTHAYINEFLELSIVTIPGFGDTTAYVVEMLKEKEDYSKELQVFLSQEEVDSKYQNPDGSFKKMTDPQNPNGKPSKFYGCVRYQMSQGKSYDSAVKICAYIKQKKKSYFEGDTMAEEEQKTKVEQKEQEKPDDNEKPNDDEKDPMEELLEKIKNLEARLAKLEKAGKKEDTENGETPEEKPQENNEEKPQETEAPQEPSEEAIKKNKKVVTYGVTEEKKKITLEELKNALKEL